ncbi:MAG: hypothetical protein WC264_01085 [Candidatus Paceibacterota bacterium]|jgi:hypothetical protein
METNQILMILICGMLWIISGLFTAFLMVFSDLKSNELVTNFTERWILDKKYPFYSVCLLIIIGPISLFLGILILIFFIDNIARK